MLHRLTDKTIFFHWQTGLLFALFFFVRILSFSLIDAPLVQTVLVFLLLMAFAVLYFKNPMWAWYVLLGELFLGSSGHYLEFINLSLRTVLIGTYIILWGLHHTSANTLHHAFRIDKKILGLILAFGIYLLFSVFLAASNQHPVSHIIQDVIPFAFLALLFPFHQMIENHTLREFMVRVIAVSILGNVLFLLFVFIFYSAGIGELHDAFYVWFRDVNMGKITDLGNGFFRIVENAHLLLVPSMLFLASLLMHYEKHHRMWWLLLFALAVMLAINFSRVYLLALIVGLFVLKYKHTWKHWFVVSIATGSMFLASFFGLSFLASGGETIGLEQLGLRATSLAQPTAELSSATRLERLPAALELIEQHPLVGVGPGATLVYFNDLTFQTEKTRHFDWGYLEMLGEFGLIGTILFLSLCVLVSVRLVQHIRALNSHYDFHVGLLGGLVAFFVMNITSPALFHVFGILFLVFLITVAIQKHSVFDDVVTLLYRVFNKKEA